MFMKPGPATSVLQITGFATRYCVNHVERGKALAIRCATLLDEFSFFLSFYCVLSDFARDMAALHW